MKPRLYVMHSLELELFFTKCLANIFCSIYCIVLYGLLILKLENFALINQCVSKLNSIKSIILYLFNHFLASVIYSPSKINFRFAHYVLYNLKYKNFTGVY